LGSGAQLGSLLLGGPLTKGITKGITYGTGLVAPKVTSNLIRGLSSGLGSQATPKLLSNTLRYGVPTAVGAPLNAAFMASGGVAQGQPASEILSGIPKNLAIGAGLGLAAPVLASGARVSLKGAKAVQKFDTAQGQAGYLKWPGSEKLTPTQYKVEAAKRLSQAASGEFQVERKVSGGYYQAAKGDKTISNRVAKEFQRNPQKFIDKYDVRQPPNVPLKSTGKQNLLDYVDKKGAYSPQAQAIRSAEINASAQKALNEVSTPNISLRGAVGKNVDPLAPQVGKPSPALPKVSLKTPPTKPVVTTKMPTEAQFNKMIPSVPGVKTKGAASFVEKAGKTPLPKRPNIPRTENPIKVTLSQPKAGEYGAAVADKQRVESNIGQAASRAEFAVKKLSEKDRSLFAYARENPKLIAKADNPKQLQEAIRRYGVMTDTAHAFDIAAGGKTAHIGNYYRHIVDLSKPEDAARFDALAQQKGYTTDPFSYQGLNNQPRVFKTIAEAEKAGFSIINKDPLQEIADYANRAKGVVSNQALARGAQLTDAARGPEAALTKKFELAPGRYVDVSPEAYKALRGVQQSELSKNPVIRGLRTANVGLKTSILSGGQFHPFNISVMRAGPAIALKGHPIRAAKGIGGTFRPLLPGGKGAVDKMLVQAQKDGMIDKAAQIGMPYGQAGYNVAGSALKHGVGHKLVFERQMPMMHNQVVRSIISDLEKKNIPLDSLEARQAGIVGNSTMGFINKEALNISPKVRQAMTDFMLAGQFTPSKFVTLSKVGKGGVAGNYARADVAANVLGATAIISGVGYLIHQKSDSIRDMLLRALVNPAVPSPYKDAKGNTQELRIPLTYTSEIAHILGIKLVRQADGHLGINWNPKNIPGTAGEWARARLSPLAGTAVKLKTNTNFSNKPLYDPNADFGTKAIQAATTLTQGFMPIATQGLAFTGPVKNRLPQSARDVLNANTPGSNPVLKSGLSSVGFSPRTDQTVGKGLSTTRYFNALNNASKGLNTKEAAALQLYAGSKKNPVTGAYDVQPNVNDSSAKAKALLDQPKVIDNLITMNQKLASQGENVDPLWQTSKDRITKILQYQAMPPGGADKSHWINQNKDWYNPLSKARGQFFDSLPAGDPNKPKAPIEYPAASPTVEAKQTKFFNLPDASSRAKYIAANPDLQQQLDNQVTYTNQLREAQGYGALDTFPTASTQVQKIIDTYNALPKNDGPKGGNKTRSLWIQANPQAYAAMTQYFTQASLYSLQKDAGQAQFKDTGLSQTGLKDIYNLGQYDIGKTTDANGNTFYALGGGSGGYGGGGGGFTPFKFKENDPTTNIYKYATSPTVGRGLTKVSIKKPTVSLKRGGRKVATKPKVSMRKSRV